MNNLKTDLISLKENVNEFYSTREINNNNEEQVNNEVVDTVETAIYGMSCDGGDVVANKILVPKDLEVDDWICIGGMGAYTFSMKSNFNGMVGANIIINLTEE